MKVILNLCIWLAMLLMPVMAPGRAAGISIGVFYDKLGPYGDWVEVPNYGYCWHPRDVDRDWRPYSEGNWAYTDVGWTWVSNEPYGWAVYHYGRWARVESVGWLWVPDVEWGPGWVSWRQSDRYIGWAPLPPESRVRVGIPFGPWVDAYYDIGPANYGFVEVRNFGAPRLSEVLLPPRENLAIINETANITNIIYYNNLVVNNGPDYPVISRETAQPIRHLRLERREDIGDLRAQPIDQLRARVQGESLIVATPVLQKASPQEKPRNVAKRVRRAEMDRGWKIAGDLKKVAATRAQMRSEAKIPEGLPPSGISNAQQPKAPAMAPVVSADNQKPDQPATEHVVPKPNPQDAAPQAPAIAEQSQTPGKGKRGKRPARPQRMPEAIAEELQPESRKPEVQNKPLPRDTGKSDQGPEPPEASGRSE